ncbi:MAG: DUF2490 domain-containing protein [Verrucomicrobiota bacterium]
MKLWLSSITLILFIGAVSSSLGEDDDTIQIWNKFTIPNYEQGKIRFRTVAQVRGVDLYNRFQRWHFTETVRYQLFDHTAVSLSGSILKPNIPTRESAPLEYRLVPRIIHQIPLTEDFTLSITNRFDFRWFEDQEDMSNRSRFMIGFKYDLPSDLPLRYFFGSNEIFYDWRAGGINQYRLTPIGMAFELNKHAIFETYYMIRFVENGSPWDRGHTFGTHLRFKF